jgi:hypothetical protein
MPERLDNLIRAIKDLEWVTILLALLQFVVVCIVWVGKRLGDEKRRNSELSALLTHELARNTSLQHDLEAAREHNPKVWLERYNEAIRAGHHASATHALRESVARMEPGLHETYLILAADSLSRFLNGDAESMLHAQRAASIALFLNSRDRRAEELLIHLERTLDAAPGADPSEALVSIKATYAADDVLRNTDERLCLELRHLHAVTLYYLGRYQEVVTEVDRILRDVGSTWNADHPYGISVRALRGAANGYGGRPKEGLSELDEVIPKAEIILGDGHPTLDRARFDRKSLLQLLGRLEVLDVQES